MPDRRTARIVFDASLRVKEVNAGALDLTRGRAHVGASLSHVKPPWLDGVPDAQSTLQRCPLSLCLTIPTLLGLVTLLVNCARHGDDLVVRFEPIEWTMGFVDQLGDLVLITGTENRPAYVNRALHQRLDKAGRSFPGASLDQIMDVVGVDRTAVDQMLGQALHGARLRYEFQKQDGLHQYVVESSPLRYCGMICGVVWTIHESPLFTMRDAQVLDALSYRLAAVYQHELRNPLQTVRAAVDLARLRGGADCSDLLDVIDRNVLQVAEILGEYPLPAANIATPPDRLSAAVAGAIAEAQLRHPCHRLCFEHNVPEVEPPVQYHRPAMTRVFANLFLNAAEARPTASVHVSYAWDERALACTVEDNGPGFPSEVLAGMLTTRDPNKHLGLVLVTATVEAHGGSVEITNATEGGARVTLRLPRPPKDA